MGTPQHTSADSTMHKVPWPVFLRDVLICSLGAYGGPEAHMSVFLDQMVTRKRYLSEADLVELIALCSILPGPTSTQTIVSIGYKMGGPLLAFATMLVWALPVLIVMTLLSFLYQFLAHMDISFDVLRFIGPMAVGFIIIAAFRIGKKVVHDLTTGLIMICSAVITYFLRAPWIFPLVLASAGVVTIILSRQKELWNRVKLNPPWIYLGVFALFAVGGIAASMIFSEKIIQLFESFYRYGYLVFGGGQVVVPVMYSELVEVRSYMTSQEFLTGYGLVQGLPGPMFSFAAYAGGMASRGLNPTYQVLGAVVGGIGIFLPGLLLIYFVYPVWEQLKQVRAVQAALRGIGAAAGGLIAVAAVILMQHSGFYMENLTATAVTVVLLATRKLPAPFIVAAALAAGFII